jgi:hypothetical protein
MEVARQLGCDGLGIPVILHFNVLGSFSGIDHFSADMAELPFLESVNVGKRAAARTADHAVHAQTKRAGCQTLMISVFAGSQHSLRRLFTALAFLRYFVLVKTPAEAYIPRFPV